MGLGLGLGLGCFQGLPGYLGILNQKNGVFLRFGLC